MCPYSTIKLHDSSIFTAYWIDKHTGDISHLRKLLHLILKHRNYYVDGLTVPSSVCDPDAIRLQFRYSPDAVWMRSGCSPDAVQICMKIYIHHGSLLFQTSNQAPDCRFHSSDSTVNWFTLIRSIDLWGLYLSGYNLPILATNANYFFFKL